MFPTGALCEHTDFSPCFFLQGHPNVSTQTRQLQEKWLKNGQMKNKDDECFGDDIEEIPDTDFDFEGNLALFDKAAVFEEIDTYERRRRYPFPGHPKREACSVPPR